METFLIATAAALAVTALCAAALLLARRARRSGPAPAERVERQEDGLEAMMRDLTAALERAKQEGRRAHALGELAASIDLDEVVARTLEAARLLPGVDAATITLTSGTSASVVASEGLTAEEETAPGELPDARVVPLTSGDDEVGALLAYSRTAGALAGVQDELAELAGRAGPILENARRYREARQLADLDALTGLHNQRYFHETLVREVARARRYGRTLALIVLDIDDFKLVNDRVGHLAGDAVLAETAERVRGVVRTADIACRVGGDEFAVILPESTLVEAQQLYERLAAAVSSRPVRHGGVVRFSAGIAELQPEDDSLKLFQRADDALYRAKDAGKATAVAAETPDDDELRPPLPEPASGGGG